MRPTRLLLAVTLTGAGAAPLFAQAQLRPAPSGRATSEVALTYPREGAPAEAQSATPVTIKLDYGQPHLRGRSLHTDSLVPYDKPWRTGANNPTTLTTGVDLVIGGATIPTGTYVLYTLPSRSGWKLIVQRSAGQTGDYDQTHDVARVDLRHQTLTAPLESLTMWLIPSTAPGKASGELRLGWGTSLLSTDWAVK
jgi:hypothetical protein